MRPNFLQALLVFCLYRAVCPSPVNINDTPLLQPVGLDTLGNTSTSRPVEWNVRFPYRIRVPNTPTVVRLGFDEPRRPLDPDEWRSFLNLVQGSIRLDIEEHGGATVYPLNIFHEQIIEKTWLGMDLEIVGSFLVPPFTYQVLWEVLQALRIFMVDGRRNYQARFNFWSGPGLFPDWGTPRGEGQVDLVAGLGWLIGAAPGNYLNRGKELQGEHGSRNQEIVEDWFSLGGECRFDPRTC